MQSFTRTIGEPVNAKTDSAKDHVLLSWDPRLGVKDYKVQIASTPDFSRIVETVTTDNPSYAPTMTQYGYTTSHALLARSRRRRGPQPGRLVAGAADQAAAAAAGPVSGFARHKHASTVRVTVIDGSRTSGCRPSRCASRASASARSRRRRTRAARCLQGEAEEEGQARRQRDEGGLPARVRLGEGAMKPAHGPKRPKVAARLARVRVPPPGAGAAAFASRSRRPPARARRGGRARARPRARRRSPEPRPAPARPRRRRSPRSATRRTRAASPPARSAP